MNKLMKVTDPTKAFHNTIKTLYDVEKQLEVALPKMADAATNPSLKEGFSMHLKETEGQSVRLEKIFSIMDASPEKHPGQSIRGLLADGAAVIAAEAPDALKDSMLAAAGRSVEHFEMACYLDAIEEAKQLGMSDVVTLLEETLAEEK